MGPRVNVRSWIYPSAAKNIPNSLAIVTIETAVSYVRKIAGLRNSDVISETLSKKISLFKIRKKKRKIKIN